MASLQGIADLLTGEGIRFTDFEMDYETLGNNTKIKEMYAIGPAISILMDGYVEKNKLWYGMANDFEYTQKTLDTFKGIITELHNS